MLFKELKPKLNNTLKLIIYDKDMNCVDEQFVSLENLEKADELLGNLEVLSIQVVKEDSSYLRIELKY